MVTQNTNPFILPGFGQTGDAASNPMLASMEMMRKAWEGMAGASGLDQSMAGMGSSPEDLERRISDLRAVENWLRMNLSMLSSTIQALEVQRSTFATLQAFVASASGASATTQSEMPSPLDVALGIRRDAGAPSADSSGFFGDGAAAKTQATASGSESASASSADKGAAPGEKAASSEESATAGPADAMMKTWWDLLQTQFDNLASATTATFQGAEAVQEAATAAQKKAVESTRAAADTMKQSVATQVAPAKKATAKKAAAKKATAKKAAAKKTTAKKTAAKKAATRTAAAKKTARKS